MSFLTLSDSSPPSPTADDFTSYDIPLFSQLPDQLCKELPAMQTTTFIEDTLQQDHDCNDGDEESDNALSHGFFFGSRSVHDLTLWESKENAEAILEEEEDFEDEGISEIYRTSSDPKLWVRQSNRSFKSSPEVTPRHAISKRIDNIGIFGHNIGLGHRLGIMSEDATLVPKSVIFQSTSFVISEDSPVQTDIHWSKPDNASTFATLVYKVETMLPNNGEVWTEVTSVRQPTFRIYHTDDKLFIGKHHVIRRNEDVTIKLRVRCHGELMFPDAARHWTMSSYSKTSEVTFVGYTPAPIVVQRTAL